MSNNITITGRLAKDPELRFSASGKAFTTVTVPDQKRVKNDRGEWEDASATTWFRATVFGDVAEELAEHAVKGDTVTVTGRLITREFTTKDGEVRSNLEVDFASVAVVPRAKATQRSGGGQQSSDPWATNGGGDAEPPF